MRASQFLVTFLFLSVSVLASEWPDYEGDVTDLRELRHVEQHPDEFLYNHCVFGIHGALGNRELIGFTPR